MYGTEVYTYVIDLHLFTDHAVTNGGEYSFGNPWKNRLRFLSRYVSLFFDDLYHPKKSTGIGIPKLEEFFYRQW